MLWQFNLMMNQWNWVIYFGRPQKKSYWVLDAYGLIACQIAITFSESKKYGAGVQCLFVSLCYFAVHDSILKEHILGRTVSPRFT